MIQFLVSILSTNQPEHLNQFLQLSAVIGVLATLLWLMGARYSRQILALVGVAAGALVGKHLPEFFPKLNMSAPVLAIVGALSLGVIAFISHRLLVGLMLGSVLVCWAGFATWLTQHGQQSWSQPVIDADISVATVQRIATDLWSVLPPDVARVLPWATGVAMLSGLALAIVWPKVATALNWSLAGATALLIFGLAATCYARPQWLGALPAQPATQAAAFTGIVLFGAMVQWKLAPQAAKVQKKPEAE